MTDTDTRDRVIQAERDMLHLNEKLDHISAKVDELHEFFTKAKGAKWMLLFVASGAGFIAGKLGGLFSWGMMK